MEIHDAARDCKLEEVKAQLAAGVNIDAKDAEQNGWTALICAANNGHGAIVTYLVEQGANKDLQDNVSIHPPRMIMMMMMMKMIVVYMLLSWWVYVWVYVCMSTYVWVCMYEYIYMSMYVCVCM